MTPTKDSDYTVPALFRGLKILEMFGQGRRTLTTREFAETLGVSQSSIYRLVQTLTELNYLNKIDRNHYELGPATVANGFSYLASREIVDVAAPHLRRVRDATSLSSHLAIRDGRETLYLYRAMASQRLSVNVPVGTRLPCHVTALGRALLADIDSEELARLYWGVQLDGYPNTGPNTLLELSRKVQEESRAGFAINQSDYATAIAAPVRNYANEIVAAINISGADVLMQGEGIMAQLTTRLIDCARTIAAELGYRETADEQQRLTG